ncbi:MAG: TaqI-like C-terminal specificity domain-containing protein, partial [Dolichospermum sp.]
NLAFPHPFYLLAIINSTLISWYHHKRNPKAQKSLFPKILVSDLKKLPIVVESLQKKDKHNKLVDLVTKILEIKCQDPKADTTKLEREIDEIVYKLYGLTEEEIQIIEDSVKR